MQKCNKNLEFLAFLANKAYHSSVIGSEVSGMRYDDCVGFWDYSLCTLLYLLKGLGWLVAGAGVLGVAGIALAIVVAVAVIVFHLVVAGVTVYCACWLVSKPFTIIALS